MNQLVSSPTVLVDQNNFSFSHFLEDTERSDPFSFEDVSNFIDYSSSGSTSSPDSNGGGSDGLLGKITGGILDFGTAISDVLPSLGIGSKSRIKETQATADANAKLYDAEIAKIRALEEAADERAQDMKSMLILGGVLIFMTLISLAILKK